jgi:hypothetical protein
MAYERKTFDILISDPLKEILEQIKNQSVVAELLLKKRHCKSEIVDNPVNFISVSSQDSKKISYLTSDRIGQLDPSEFWTSPKRFHIKPGGFVSKIFKNISQQDIEVFSNLFRLESCKPNFRFEIVSGEDIRKYYHYSYHSNDDGSLGVSCMRYDSCQKMFDIYCENPDKISMLIMFNQYDNVIGRSLLWNFDENKIMDRIYTNNDEQLPFYFKKWAKDNGYYHRTQQNWYNSVKFQSPTGEKTILKLKLKLENFDFRYYPYLDTFRFLDLETGVISNFKPDGDFRTLCSSDGSTYSSDYLVFDEIENIFRQKGDCVYLNYLDTYTSPNNCVYSEVHDDYILNDHSEWREDCRDYIYSGEWSHLNNVDAINNRINKKSRSSQTIQLEADYFYDILRRSIIQHDISLNNEEAIEE